MIIKITIVILSILSLAGLVLLYGKKIVIQYQYLRLKNRLKPSAAWDVFAFKMKTEKESQLRNQAWMLYPLMFPVEMETEKEDLENLKGKVKKIHIALYVLLMVVILLGVYTSKAYPNGMF